jgi:hypothetical protein
MKDDSPMPLSYLPKAPNFSYFCTFKSWVLNI